MGSKYTQSQFLEAIKGSGGIVSTIAKRVGCEWDTAKKWITEKPKLKQAFDNERESILDMAEGVLLKSIQGGDSQDAKWVLSRLGKSRGYVERQELKVESWRDKIIDALRRGEVDKEQVKARLGDKLAIELFIEAGVNVS